MSEEETYMPGHEREVGNRAKAKKTSETYHKFDKVGSRDLILMEWYEQVEK